jgi:hypothetical protein
LSPINSERAKAIQAAIELPTATSEFRVAPIVIAGEKAMHPVYRLPIKLLAFNIRNGRFAAELKATERELKRQLNPLDANDAGIIRDLLLKQDANATEVLKEDLKKIGQTEPGIITHDGFVINGNRRMAILHELHTGEPTGKFAFLDVQILPPKIDDKDMWRIEAGLQLSRDKRLVYGPVNDLLKIREGLNAGLSPDEIAATLYGGGGPEEIREKDELLKLIDSYLSYINKSEDYVHVQRMVEHFINLLNFQQWLQKKAGATPRDRHKWLLIAFEMIRSGKFGHMKIRELRDVYAIKESREHLETTITADPAKEMTDTRTQEIVENFDTATEYVELEKDIKKPERLLSRAERAIQALVKHKKDVAREKKLHKRITRLRNLIGELEKACSVRQDRS